MSGFDVSSAGAGRRQGATGEPKAAPAETTPGETGATPAPAGDAGATTATNDAHAGAAATGDHPVGTGAGTGAGQAQDGVDAQGEQAPAAAPATAPATAPADAPATAPADAPATGVVSAPQLPDGQPATAANIDAVAPPAGEQRDQFRAQQDAALEQDPAAYWSSNVGGVYIDGDGTAYAIQSYDASTGQVQLVRTAAETNATPQPGITRDQAEAGIETVPEQQRASFYGPGGPWEYASGPNGAIFQSSYDPQTGDVTWTEVAPQYTTSYGILVNRDGSSTYTTNTIGLLSNGGVDLSQIDSSYAPDGSATGSSILHHHTERDTSGAAASELVERAYFDGTGTVTATDRVTDQTTDGVSIHTQDSTGYASGLPAARRIATDIHDAAGPISSSLTDIAYTADGQPTRLETWSDDYGTFTEPGNDAAGFSEQDGVRVRRQAHQVLDGQGQPLAFDEEGHPTNATGTIDITTSVDRGRDSVDDADQTRDKVYVQRGTYGASGVEWQSLSEQDVRFSYDPARRWQVDEQEPARTFTGDELDAEGFPTDGGGGWRGLVGTALSIMGEVLVFGGQLWGAGLIGVGTVVMLSQDVPAFIRNPSFGNALQVGIDVVGGMGGAANAVRGVRYLGRVADAARVGEGAMVGAQFVYNAETGQLDGWQQYLLGGIGVGFAARGASRRPMGRFAFMSDLEQTAAGAGNPIQPAGESIGGMPAVQPPQAPAA